MSMYAYYSVDDVPDHFQKPLTKIAEIFDRELGIEDYDDEWVHFHVDGYDEVSAVTKIEKSRQKVLPGNQVYHYQVLCQWNPPAGSGLWLHHLSSQSLRNEYKYGVWYYEVESDSDSSW